jgi:hypothetical protein
MRTSDTRLSFTSGIFFLLLERNGLIDLFNTHVTALTIDVQSRPARLIYVDEA